MTLKINKIKKMIKNLEVLIQKKRKIKEQFVNLEK